MKHFKPSLITAAMISSGLAFVSHSAVAQQNNAAAEQDVEIIQVSGIRGSLQRAQALKMDNTSIVEAISAEDIGKLPDTSVAESLARLPGLTGERRNGRTSGLSVRGFNENYVGTSLNGRELLGMGDNRGVEFELYPTEIIANILVYKTPEAGLLNQGIGGTIDLQTINPLNAEKTLTFNANFEQNAEDATPGFDNKGHRFSANFVDQFLDDKLGLALTIASQETPRQENQFRGWGYDPANAAAAGTGVQVPAGTSVLSGHDSYTRSALLERNSIAAVVEYAPTDKLKMQLDALYIDFEENDAKRGLEEGFRVWNPDAYTITGVEGGLVTSGNFEGFHSVIRNDARKQDAKLTTVALNVEYELNEDWILEFDYSTGDVKKTITDVESYSGVGRAGIDGRPVSARSWQMTSNGAMFSNHPTIAPVDLTDPNLVRLAGPQAWGASLSPVARFQGNPNFAPNTAQDGFVNAPKFDEELDSIRLQVNGNLEWGIFTGLEAGVNYSERTKKKTNQGYYLTAPTWPVHGPIPNVLGTADLSFIGINGVVAYDSLALYNSGFYTQTAASTLETGRLGDTYTVEEEVLTAFAKLDIDTEIGDVFVRGNLGLQIVSADQKANGFSTFTARNLFVDSTPTSGSADYTDVLPSLNLSFEIAENQFIRTAMSKVQSRPRLDDMRPNTTVSFSRNDGEILSTSPGPWTGSSGNPELKPLEANQFDLSYENYFVDDGYFAISFFYKDLKNWHREGVNQVDFTQYYIPGFHASSDDTNNVAPATFTGNVSFREDGLTGFVRGYEFQTSLPFHVFSKSLEGFGLVMSATFIDGELDVANPGDDKRVPGLSEESYSLTAYYESNGFEVRISGTKRDDFLTEERGLSLSLVGATDQGAELWDAQIGYDFSESDIEWLHGLRVTLQGQNLTDEDTIRTNDSGDSRQIVRHQSFGRNYLLGFNYSF